MTLERTATQSAGVRRDTDAVATTGIVNAMSVDVEEHFQVSAMEGAISRTDWDRHASRVERNIDTILELFARHHVQATFFTLGWIAERHPGLVRRIAEAGHEIASHGMAHHRVSSQTPEAFRTDVRAAKARLEDCSGGAVRGYRAASFSLTAETDWAHTVLAEEGYAYSSSIYPIRHDHYGMPSAPRGAFRPISGGSFLEIPIATLEAGGRRWPFGGGGYFRLMPYALSRWGIRRINRVDGMPAVFYFHPWEVDPGQPRVPGIGWRTRFRHYVNLARMQGRLDRLLAGLAWSRIDKIFLGSGEA